MADFQAEISRFDELGARVAALSVDSEADARKTVERHGISYPVLCELDARRAAERIGCYLNPDPVFIQPTGVVLRPDASVQQVTYSSGPVGRLTAKETAALIAYVKKKG